MPSTLGAENTKYLRCPAKIVAAELNRRYLLVAVVGELRERAPMLMETAILAVQLIIPSLVTPRTT